MTHWGTYTFRERRIVKMHAVLPIHITFIGKTFAPYLWWKFLLIVMPHFHLVMSNQNQYSFMKTSYLLYFPLIITHKSVFFGSSFILSFYKGEVLKECIKRWFDNIKFLLWFDVQQHQFLLEIFLFVRKYRVIVMKCFQVRSNAVLWR